MSNPGLNIKDQKQRGEWAELRFLARVSELGMTVTRPWGDSRHYDLVVEADSCLLRVQVKSCASRKHNSYLVNVHGGKHHYTKDDFEFLAAYIIPLDLWYIIPSDAALVSRDRLCMTPGSGKAKYEPYREAWHLLKQKHCAGNIRDCDLCYRHGCQNRVREQPAAEKLEP